MVSGKTENKVIRILKSGFGIKENHWVSVHSEIETADGGAWFTSGDEYVYDNYSKWFYLFWIPVWRLKRRTNCRGLYEDIYK